ncbi:MAG: hypothetical protein AAGU75_03555 [Bacillota bacterium]
MNRLSNYVRPFLLLLLFSPFIYFQVVFLPVPAYEVKTYQQFSTICNKHGMLVPSQDTLPDGDASYSIRLASKNRWSAPKGYLIQIDVGDTSQEFVLSIDCSKSETLSWTSTEDSPYEEYGGVDIKINQNTWEVSEGNMATLRRMEFSLDRYYYSAEALTMPPEESVLEETTQVLTNVAHSLIQQQTK